MTMFSKFVTRCPRDGLKSFKFLTIQSFSSRSLNTLSGRSFHTLPNRSFHILSKTFRQTQMQGAALNPFKRFFTSNANSWNGDKGVAAWLFGLGGLVFSMVVIGGLTRLTKSGLAMTDWKFTGQRPPISQEDWEAEFEKYKLYPEFKKDNQDMTVNEFKFIYFMEYGHRQLGRVIGLAFIVPFGYFVAKKRLTAMPGLSGRCGLIGCMIVSQGLVGWWMVRSGLTEPEHNRAVRVSPYRLAAHLLSAFCIYSVTMTTAFDVLPKTQRALHSAAIPNRLRILARVATGLLGATIASGAFVAGNEAGLVYNEFPYMGHGFVPEDVVDPYLEPKWRNFFENSSLVQFDHRALSLSTAAVLGTLVYQCSKVGLSANARLASRLLVVVTGGQVTLGIVTLLMYVPIPLASAHQAGALTLTTMCLWLLQSLRTGNVASVSRTAQAAVNTAAHTAVPARGFATIPRHSTTKFNPNSRHFTTHAFPRHFTTTNPIPRHTNILSRHAFHNQPLIR